MGRPMVSPRAEAILRVLRASGAKMNRRELCAATGINKYDLYRAIALLRREGAIQIDGNTIRRTYQAISCPRPPQ